MTLKSVIDVDINDAKFKRFAADFAKYQKALGKTGGAWSKVQKDIGKVAGFQGDMSKHLKAQENHLKRQHKLYGDIKNATGKIASDMKSVSSSIINTTRNLLRWGGAGGIISGLLGAGGLFGLDRLASSVGDGRRSAQGLGVSAGNKQAFSTNFGRYVDPQANLSAIADAKSNYANRWAFSAMGVNPNGKDPAQLAVEMAMRAKSIYDKGDGSEQYAQSRGLLQFYSMEDLRRFGATNTKDLRRSTADYYRDSKKFGMSDATQKSYQDFAIQMDRASLQIKTAFVEGLKPLVDSGVLPKLSEAVADALTTFMKSDALKKLIPELAKGIKSFADYLSDAKFQQDLRAFVTNFGLVTDAVVRALKFLHVIPDTPGGGGGGGAMKADSAYQQRAIPAMARYFMGRGWTKNQSAGILANLVHESQLNPFAPGDGGRAYGIAQWHPDRQAQYAKLFNHTMQSVTDPKQALAEQMRFVNYELTEGMWKAAGRDLKDQLWANRAAEVVSLRYEKPAAGAAEAERRGRTAQGLVIKIDNNTGGNANVGANQAAAQ